MSDKICACQRGVNVLYNGVLSRSKRDILFKLYKSERDGMRSRSDNININDGNSLYRICVTMRANVILRGNSNNKSDISDTVCRGRYSTMSMRGV